MIDFRPLGYFLVACEHENLGAAARTLGIAPSTLGANLKALESDFGVALFRKQGTGLSPRELAHWLYRAAVPLLLLERFARNRVAAPADAAVGRLQIDIRLRFAFGQFRRALSVAIARTLVEEPLVLAEPHWPLGLGGAFARDATDSLGFTERAAVIVDAVPRPADAASGEVLLRTDPWVRLRRQDGSAHVDRADDSFIVPDFPAPLVEQIGRWARANAAAVQLVGTPPRDWPQILDNHPSAVLLVPASVVGTRLGVARMEAIPLDPPLSCSLVARSDGHPIADRFIRRLHDAFDAGDQTPVFDPVLTSKRLQYFNLAFDLGRISAAARASNVAQPALSQQLLKLEESLGTSLFDRRTTGLVRTEAGALFARATSLLERRLKEVETSGRTAAVRQSGRLSIGFLPSVGHQSGLVNSISEAVARLQQRYPAMRLTAREAPTAELLEWVQRGVIGLAVVETVLPQLPRLPLDATEPLAVVADPRHRLLPPGPVRLSDLHAVPLAMPTRPFGIRQLLDKAARAAGIDLDVRHEIDALAMLIAHLPRAPVATVLPASAVAREIAEGRLSAHPIIEPTLDRRLFITYSADRSLTAIERELIRSLRHVLHGEADA